MATSSCACRSQGSPSPPQWRKDRPVDVDVDRDLSLGPRHYRRWCFLFWILGWLGRQSQSRRMLSADESPSLKQDFDFRPPQLLRDDAEQRGTHGPGKRNHKSNHRAAQKADCRLACMDGNGDFELSVRKARGGRNATAVFQPRADIEDELVCAGFFFGVTSQVQRPNSSLS
jgi:hypothetical protein